MLNFLITHIYSSMMKQLNFNNLKSKVEEFIKKNSNKLTPLDQVSLKSPIPNPNSFRDAYAFRQHVETSRRNRGVGLIKEFDDFLVFYFSSFSLVRLFIHFF